MAKIKRPQYLDRGWVGAIVFWGTAILAAVAFFEFRVRSGFYDFNDRVGQIVNSQIHPERPDVPLRTHYTGLAPVDYALRYMVAIHLAAFAGFVEVYYVELAYLVVSVSSIMVVYTVEAGRRGCSKSGVRYISLWTLFYAALGGAVGLPIWFMAFLRHSSRRDLHQSPSAQLPVPYAKALLPAHILGYFWSCVTVLFPFDDPLLSKKQLFIAIWIASPFTVNFLLAIFTKVFEFVSNEKAERSSANDASYVKLLYALCFFPSAVAHIVLLYTSTQAQWTLMDIFFPRKELMAGSISQMVYYIFVLDFAIMFLVALATAYIVIVDLQTIGRSSLSPITVVAMIVLATCLIGPAATIMAAWWWREDRIRTDKKDTFKSQ